MPHSRPCSAYLQQEQNRCTVLWLHKLWVLQQAPLSGSMHTRCAHLPMPANQPLPATHLSKRRSVFSMVACSASAGAEPASYCSTRGEGAGQTRREHG